MTDINLLLATDDRYAPYAGTVLRSAVMSGAKDDHLSAFVLTFGLNDENKEKFAQLAKDLDILIKIVLVDEAKVSNLPESNVTKNTYLRMFAPELLPKLTHVVYLDADLLVKGSLGTLAHVAQSAQAGAVAPDHMSMFDTDDLKFEIPDNFNKARYFNAGVMAMNLDYYRKHSIGQKCCDILMREHKFSYKNQSPMNIILEGKNALTSIGFNVSPRTLNFFTYGWADSREYGLNSWDDVVVVHYTGGEKPWMRCCRGYDSELFRAHLARTPWGSAAIIPLSRADIWTFLCNEANHLKFYISYLRRRLLGKIPPRPFGRFSGAATSLHN